MSNHFCFQRFEFWGFGLSFEGLGFWGLASGPRAACSTATTSERQPLLFNIYIYICFRVLNFGFRPEVSGFRVLGWLLVRGPDAPKLPRQLSKGNYFRFQGFDLGPGLCFQGFEFWVSA
jgi:hypothetical protein